MRIRYVQTRTALWIAIACGAAAVGLVAFDLAWNLTTKVEAEIDGEWMVIASSDGGHYAEERPLGPFGFEGDCVEERFRITAVNDQPLATSLDVLVVQSGRNESVTLLQETWHIDRFSQRQETMELAPMVESERPYRLEIHVGEHRFHPCIAGQQEAFR